MSKAQLLGGKECSRCNVFQGLEDFSPNPRSADGRAYACRSCRREADAKAREAQVIAAPPESDRSGFVQSHFVGTYGEARFIAFAAERGWHAFKGFSGHEPYDYVIDTGDGLLRVEVKCTMTAKQRQRDPGSDYCIITKLSSDEDRFDYLFVVTPKGAYWIPRADCPTHSFSTKLTGKTRRDKWEAFRVG